MATGSFKANLSGTGGVNVSETKANRGQSAFIYSALKGNEAAGFTEYVFIVDGNQAAGFHEDVYAVAGDNSKLITQFYGKRDVYGIQSVIGALKGISMGGPTSYLSDGTFGRHMQVGVTQSYNQGSPSPPCLQITYPGFWRFRWVVQVGPRSIYVNALQPTTLAYNYPPSIVVKANPAVGLYSDVTSSVANAQTWTTMGPTSFVASAKGVVWVELWNNNTNEYDTPCYFDHIVAT